MSHNRLSEETSPYLFQHKDNPVHWQPWDDRALAQAKSENKPILLSVGYAACHWCHVMAHESFEDPATANVMNTHYINIKVDREERPDIDALYQQALALTNQQGGWPLTMFLTPTGDPFWGGTYFPPSGAYGRPGFSDLLNGIARTWADEPQKINDNVTMMKDGIARLSTIAAPGTATPDTWAESFRAAAGYIDPVAGGTFGAPKFPQPSLFRFLWHGVQSHPDAKIEAGILNSLDRMCMGGIYDHLAGGFSRYSVDEHWLVPHFEKMLYDNALLISLLTQIWRSHPRPLYEIRVRETIEWCLRDLWIDGPDGSSGAFASSFDADSLDNTGHLHEGAYYVWDAEEIDQILAPKEADLFRMVYGAQRGGNWEGHTILNRLTDPHLNTPEVENRLTTARQTLLAARQHRHAPTRDDKILADWNGLMISALAEAGVAFAQTQWIARAEAVFTFVRQTLRDGDQLAHSWAGGRAAHPATLEDYANLADAALTLHQITAKPQYRDQAEAWVDEIQRRFADEPAGGYFLSAADVPHLIARTMPFSDSAVPAGNGTITMVLAKLHHLTGKATYKDRAHAVLDRFVGDKETQGLAIPTLLVAKKFLENPTTLVIIGDTNARDSQALRHLAFATKAPAALIVLNITPDAALPPDHPAHGKAMIDGQPTAYLCHQQTCGPPHAAPTDVRKALAALLGVL